jgi:hypothetical protein
MQGNIKKNTIVQYKKTNQSSGNNGNKTLHSYLQTKSPKNPRSPMSLVSPLSQAPTSGYNQTRIQKAPMTAV